MEDQKRLKIDASDIPVTKRTLTFSELPLEIQETILIKAAVPLLLSCELYENVYAVLGSVCKDWNDILTDKVFRDRVIQLASLIDPMCRYVKTAQRVRINGLLTQDNVYTCAATLGDKLYVSEESWSHGSLSSLYVYDFDDSLVRHASRSQRKITLSNRTALKISGQTGDVTMIIPCRLTKYLYVIEDGKSCRHPAIIHKLDSDGTRVLHWSPTFPVCDICAVSLTKSGGHLAFVTYYSSLIYVYSTSTGELCMHAEDKNLYHKLTMHVDDKDDLGGLTMSVEYMNNDGVLTPPGSNTNDNAVFVKVSKSTSTVLLDERKMDILLRYLHGNNDSSVDGHGCFLRMSESSMLLVDIQTDHCRKLLVDPTAGRYEHCRHFYDISRGLVFCVDWDEIRVLRVTY